MFQSVKVAAISFVPKKFELEANCDRLEQMFRRAAKGGAQLALGPEGILEGYVVTELLNGEVPLQRMNNVAIQMRGPEIGRFRDLAKELGICLAFGCAEKIGRNVYNCAVFIDQSGKLCGKYHKMQLAEGSHSSWWFNRLGKKSRAVKTPFGRCGFLICNDRWNADIGRLPVLDGARYLLIPSYGDCTKRQDEAVLARAWENGVPVVEANVGRTLIISKGKIVAHSREKTKLLFGTIEVPAPPSAANRDEHERSFLRWRRKEMPIRYRQQAEKRKRKVTKPSRHDPKGRLY